MLKFKISKAGFAKLDAAMQALYKEDGDEYTLQVDGIDTGEEIKTAKAQEVEAHKVTKKALADAKRALGEAEGERDEFKKLAEASVPSANLETLKKSWETEKNKLITEHTTKTEKLKGALTSKLVDSVANEMATKLSTSPKVFSRVVRDRLTVIEDSDGNFKTGVLDANGKESVMSLADLEKEFLADKELKNILKAGAGSGGGAPPSPKGGGAPGELDYSKASAKDIAAHLKASGKVDLSNVGDDE